MRKRREEAKTLKETKPEDAPLSMSPRKMINTLGTDLNLFLLLLMLPLVAVPFIIKHFGPSDEQAAYSLTVFCDTFYILLATVYGLVVGLLLKRNSPKIKYSLLMSALLYGQTLFLWFLIVNIDLNPIKIFLIFYFSHFFYYFTNTLLLQFDVDTWNYLLCFSVIFCCRLLFPHIF